MSWIELLSTFLGTALTALSVVGVVSQYLKFAHKNIGKEAVKWNDLERDLSHLKRNKDSFKAFVKQVEDEIHSLELTATNVQGQLTVLQQLQGKDDTKDKIENLLVRVAKLEGENRLLLAEKYGMQST